MLLRVLAFGKKYADLFPRRLARKMFAIIGATLPEFEQCAGSQVAGIALNPRLDFEKAGAGSVV